MHFVRLNVLIARNTAGILVCIINCSRKTDVRRVRAGFVLLVCMSFPFHLLFLPHCLLQTASALASLCASSWANYSRKSTRENSSIFSWQPLVSSLSWVIFVFAPVCVIHYLTDHALVSPEQSPWTKLYAEGDDLAFLNTMGFTRQAFNNILTPFALRWQARPQGLRIQRIKVNAPLLLGLALHYLNSTMKQKTLQMLFGMTQISRHLAVALRLLYDTLKNDIPEAKIQWPTHKQLQVWSDMVSSWEPGLRGIFGMVDGLALPIQTPGNPQLQRAYYNGWKR